MNLFEKFLYFLEAEMPRPTNYGWFHLMFLGIAVAAIVFLCLKFRDCSTKTFNRILMGAWIVLVIGEVVKQLLFSFNFDGTSVTWDYMWYAFPYQLCGTPFIVLPFIIFTKEGKFRDACLAFMALFSLFGGLATYCYPNDVFTSQIVINIQTMIHHGTQVILGVFIAVHNRRKLTFKYYLGGVGVFVALSALALIMDVWAYNVIQTKGLDEVFNMFFISPYYDCTLPVLSAIYPVVPYPVFLLIYVIGFMIIAAVVHYITKGIAALLSSNNRKTDIYKDEKCFDSENEGEGTPGE